MKEKSKLNAEDKNRYIQLFITLVMLALFVCGLCVDHFLFDTKDLKLLDFSNIFSAIDSILIGLVIISISYVTLLLMINLSLVLFEIICDKQRKTVNFDSLRNIIHNSIVYSIVFFGTIGFLAYFVSIFKPAEFITTPSWGFLAFSLTAFCLTIPMIKKFRVKIVEIWNYFSLYEKIWFFGIMIASVVVAILFPEEDVNGVNGGIIMALYLSDIVLNVMCELLISKQSRWNFIISLAIEIVELATLLILSAMFASIATLIFFWIPIDIISFINWSKHKDKKEEEVTAVRRMNWWQNIIFVVSVAAFTLGAGYLLARYSPDSDFFDSDKIKRIVAYLDSCESAIAVANGVFIWLRFREQWGTWIAVTILEGAINIITGQWVLLVLKVGYLTNSIYGYIKWTKYIKTHTKNDDAATKPALQTNANSTVEMEDLKNNNNENILNNSLTNNNEKTVEKTQVNEIKDYINEIKQTNSDDDKQVETKERKPKKVKEKKEKQTKSSKDKKN